MKIIKIVQICLLISLCAFAETVDTARTAAGGSASLEEVSGNERIFSKWEWVNRDVADIMKHISMAADVDIVVDPKVEKELSLTIHEKNWKDVFRVVCRMGELHYQKMDNYLYVMGKDEYIRQQLKKEQDKRNLESLKDLERRIIDLDNTVAADLVGSVQPLLSDRGSVHPVKSTNSLIVEELPVRFPALVQDIKSLDQELMQISIEVKIVEVAKRVDNNLGVQWSFFNNEIGVSAEHLKGTSGEGVISNALERATYGILNDDMFQVAMEYLFTETNSKVVAEPHITTLENSEAKVFMGANVPVTQLDEAGNSVTQLVPAGTELSVTPTITKNNQIKMVLNPIKKSYELTDQGPIISEQGAMTNVSVKDGETIVIGGLTSDENREQEGGIPLLKDIPIIGFLFKKSERSQDNKDLVIFVTPHIVKTNYSAMDENNIKDSVHVSQDDFVVE
ncbi:MAG: type II secretion system protein GspD [Fibrobacterota bacterium]